MARRHKPHGGEQIGKNNKIPMNLLRVDIVCTDREKYIVMSYILYEDEIKEGT